ncbi:GNAT family N-acetyltransferase [Rickettsiales bacterium LUAb2]
MNEYITQADAVITYEVNPSISIGDFVSILERSALAERRPVTDSEAMSAMLNNSQLVVVAKCNDLIVGIGRAITDFYYCCYLSELAVDEFYQRQGIGKEIIRQIRAQLSISCKIILLAAPDAVNYYSKIGFNKHNSAWILEGRDEIG